MEIEGRLHVIQVEAVISIKYRTTWTKQSINSEPRLISASPWNIIIIKPELKKSRLLTCTTRVQSNRQTKHQERRLRQQPYQPQKWCILLILCPFHTDFKWWTLPDLVLLIFHLKFRLSHLPTSVKGTCFLYQTAA